MRPLTQRQSGQRTKFEIGIKAKALVLFTFKTTAGNMFPKRWRFTLVNRMQEASLNVIESVLDANDTHAVKEHEKRYELQRAALSNLNKLLFLIELSLEVEIISPGLCRDWSKMATELKWMVAGWITSDKERLRKA